MQIKRSSTPRLVVRPRGATPPPAPEPVEIPRVVVRQETLDTEWYQRRVRELENLKMGLVGAAPLPLVLFNARGQLGAWNAEAEALFGWQREEVIGRCLPGLDKAQEERLSALRDEVFQGGRVERAGLFLRRQDGTAFPALLSGAPVYGHDGNVTAMVAYIEDQSELSRLRDQASNSRNLSRLAGRMARLGAWNLPVPPGVEAGGRAANRGLLGIITRYPFLRPLLETYIPEDHEHLATAFARCIEENQPFDITARIAAGDGQIHTVRSTGEPVRDANGVLVQIAGGIQDITHMAETEDKLSLQSAALDAVENMLVITDVEGRVQWANPSFCRTTGYALEEVLGRALGPLIHSDTHPPEFFEKMWRTLLAGKVWQGEVVNRTKAGEPLVEHMTITPFCRGGDQVTHFVAVKQNITERKKIEKQVLRAQRTESLGSLAGGIAHDLNNVLAPIMMGLELLRLDEKDPQRLQTLDSILGSARRGSDLVRQILGFARGGEGRRKSMDMRVPLRELQRMVERTFPKNIHTLFSVADDLWTLQADATQMYQIMLNLCMNARDAMPGGGTLSVSLQNCMLGDNDTAAKAGLKAGPHLLLEVRDTGSGIPPELWDKLFDPFFTTKPPGEGTGLGLATLQQIVHKHGGRVHFESGLGRGTHFRVFLPADETVFEQPLKADGGPLLLHGSDELILVIDDEDPIRAMTRQSLERHGYRVEDAANGEVALREFRAHPDRYRLLLVDMDMPVMSGPDVIRAVRAVRPDLPILGCSGHAKPEVIEDAARSGMDDFLPKPYSTEQLLSTIYLLLHPAPAPEA